MTVRTLTAIAAAVVIALLMCSGLAATLTFGSSPATATCLPPTSRSTPPTTAPTPVTRAVRLSLPWSSEQTSNAAAIITTGIQRRVPPRGWVIAVATAMQESSLINIPGGADDSLGLFQQRPSQGWGIPRQLLDPAHAATTFYTRLVAIDGWQAMPLTQAAQKVQISAYPDAYAKWEPDATRLVTALSGTSTGLIACSDNVSAQGWTLPVHAVVGSGFRTSERPSHDGVDLIVGKGTPVHAATAGVVSRVRCNAINKRTGAPWGCDRDGDPQLTAGCGWYVDIDHAEGIVTRYCHLLTQPAVRVGQYVTAGEVIGRAGSSGHSSGPHLHFEIHRGDHSPATAVDPVAFMASVGARLP